MWSYKTLPWIAAFAALPGSVWIVALFRRKVKAVSDISTLIFCAAVDKEIQRLGVVFHMSSFYPRDNPDRQNEK